MRLNLILGGWFLDEQATRQQLPLIRYPSEDDIFNILNVLRARTGVVVLKNKNALRRDPYEMVLYVDSGKYLAMLNEYDENENSVTRTFNKKNEKNEFISIIGEMYPQKSVLSDFNILLSAFKEFSRTGNVTSMS